MKGTGRTGHLGKQHLYQGAAQVPHAVILSITRYNLDILYTMYVLVYIDDGRRWDPVTQNKSFERVKVCYVGIFEQIFLMNSH